MQLYLYEKNQFVNPDKSKNLKALKMWKQNHKIIFNAFNLCDSFIIIDWFDSTYSKHNKQWNREVYVSSFYLCGDSGAYLNYIDSFKLKKFEYINSKNHFLIDKILIDSIISKNPVNVLFLIKFRLIFYN